MPWMDKVGTFEAPRAIVPIGAGKAFVAHTNNFLLINKPLLLTRFYSVH